MPLDVLLQPRAFCWFGQHVHRLAENFGEAALRAHQPEQADMGVRIELSGKIDGAKWAGFAAGD